MSTSSQNEQTVASPSPPSTKRESATTGTPPGSPPAPAGKAKDGAIAKLKKWLETSTKQQKWLIVAAVLLVGAGVGYVAWLKFRPPAVPEGFARSNGRIEATEVDIATKLAGRVLDELVDEGDLVTAGQMLAHMNVDVLMAQLNEARAQRDMAKSSADAARSVLAQRDSEKAAAESRLAQRDAGLKLAASKFARRQALVKKGGASQEELETEEADFHSAEAAVSSGKAEVAASDAAIATAKAQIIAAESAIVSAVATIERVQADIDDSTLKSPRDGRVQYRVAQPGEVLSGGGKVLNMVDLGDVYMTFFLPTDWAGRVKLGAETRIILDAAPQFVIPAKVTFVADVAQFTPKTVETAEERQKLTFRIKAHIPPEVLKKYVREVKTGLPGVAYVQLDPQEPWPANLQVKLPE